MVRVEWSADALADLDRFGTVLRENHPALSTVVAREIVAKTKILSEHLCHRPPARSALFEGRGGGRV